MAPRAYNNESRLAQQEALKARIAAAAAGLHAEKGALATSYAEIAQRAGVSLPTVYKHYPTLDDLIPACTGHVAARAPRLPVDDMLSAPGLPAAVDALVGALDRTHAHFEPWMAWNEQASIPSLSAMLDEQRRQLAQVAARVLAAHAGAGDHRETAAVWESLLSFALWHRLVREHKLSRAAARRHLAHLLLAVAGPQPAAPSPRPNNPRK